MCADDAGCGRDANAGALSRRRRCGGIGDGVFAKVAALAPLLRHLRIQSVTRLLLLLINDDIIPKTLE
jgi:hypothetical protein